MTVYQVHVEARRLDFASHRNHVTVPKSPRNPPNLFGAYERMNVLTALARHGTLRRADVIRKAGLCSIDLLHVSDSAGLISRWRLEPASSGYAVALNPAFPLSAELRKLLLILEREFPTPYRSTCPPPKRGVPPKAEREGRLDELFTSTVRTMTLLALELLGGQAPQSDLYRSVPDQTKTAVKNVMKFYIGQGVLSKSGTTMRFARNSWSEPLRDLLRGLALARPDLAALIHRNIDSSRRRFARSDHRSALLGYESFERALMSLAADGPSSFAHVFGSAGADVDKGLEVYSGMGLVISHKNGHDRTYSLNAAHPIAAELRELLLAMCGRRRAPGVEDFADASRAFSVERLFQFTSRTALLLTLFACPSGLDATTLTKLLPQFDASQLRKGLKRFTELGPLKTLSRGKRVDYVFDNQYQFFRELKALLTKANSKWPKWRKAAEAAPRYRGGKKS